MTKKMRADGLLAVGIAVTVLVVAAISFGGWYVWHKNNKSELVVSTSTTTQTKDTEKTSGFQAPSGWSWYENKDMGLKFAYPKTWTVGEPRTVATSAGEQGWTVETKASSPQNGDPDVTFTTYPGNATIKDVDAGLNDIKVRDATTADKLSFTLVGQRDDSVKLAGLQAMYASTCWPRYCIPKLLNGRFLGIAASAINNDCEPKVYCPTEINSTSGNYQIFLNILKSITSL